MLTFEPHSAAVTLVAPQCDGLTAVNAASFKRSLMALVDEGHNRLVIDMGGIAQVDSSGIGALVGLVQRIGLRGEVVLCGLTEKVASAFRLTRMDQIFAIHRDSAGALRALGA